MISVLTLWIQLFTNSEKPPKKFFCAQNGRNRSYRNFCIPENDLIGVVCPNFFRPAPKEFQSPHKTIFMPVEPFWGSGGLSESKNADNRLKTRFYRNFCTPKIDLFGAGWPKIFRPAPMGAQSTQKNFLVIPNPFLGSIGLREPKTANFRPKTEISACHFGRNFCMWVSGPRQKFFPTPATPKVSPKKNLGS